MRIQACNSSCPGVGKLVHVCVRVCARREKEKLRKQVKCRRGRGESKRLGEKTKCRNTMGNAKYVSSCGNPGRDLV